MRALACLMALLLWPGLAAAQLATLVADRVEVRADRTLVAEGNVEVLYDGTRVRATRVVYDRVTERLEIAGPITLVDGDSVLVLADQAALDADLRNGLLTSARLVLDQQLQLAANEIARVSGRYTQLSRVVASSCEVCPENPVPTWEIRARKVIHDQEARQLYFDNATFRVMGVPILYLPRLRLPDPTLDRASGFLLPELQRSSLLGTGVKLPYFLRLGDHADLTLTPFLTGRTRTLEASYRQALRFGDIAFRGAVSRDELGFGNPRYYLFGEGVFALPKEFRLGFDIQEASDAAYLLDYGYSDEDRLASEVFLTRARRNDLFQASLTDFRTLRASEIPIETQLPDVYGTLSYERRIPLWGGELRLGLDAATLTRESRVPGVGRDVDRAGISADYTRSWLWANGIVGRVDLGFTAASYRTEEDPAFDRATGQMTPRGAVTLRWPFQRTGTGGAHHLIEPVVQLAWADTDGNRVPNEDSLLVEFDEGNLFAFSRFPGEDVREEGARANLGLRYTRVDPSGWSLDLTVGRVVRSHDPGQFLPGTGLDGVRSDWVAAAQFRVGSRLAVTNRALFDDSFDVTKNEARLAWQSGDAALSSSYIWMIAEPGENRQTDTHELALDAAYRVGGHWTARFNGRYDFAADEPARAGVGLEYRSECLTLGLSLSRRFTSSTNVRPSTDFGFQFSLGGIGSGRNDRSYRRKCAG
ncbi:LPS-assembly protein LptD [Rhodobacteraceae bacterium CCMM004]|nr:LPS-assembly protein LptD [Rhodobacteraceae bacterium CCMM004]